MSKLEKWQAEAREQGWVFVKSVDGSSAVYAHAACGREQKIARGDMRRGSVRCQHCKEQAWRDEAAAQGWTFIHNIDGNHAAYSHNACGQERQLVKTYVRNGVLRCRHCMKQAWRDEAAAQGWAFIAQIAKDWATYTHDVCGHEQKVQIAAMGRGSVRCQHCKEQVWRDEASVKDWTFVTKIDEHYATYKHNACGHEQQITAANMTRTNPRCQYCMEQAWRDSATAQGWTFVKQVNPRYASYSCNVCGHAQQATIGNILRSAVACHGCGKSWVSKPSNVYLLDITTTCGQRFLKVGVARIVTRRTQEYGLVDGAKIKVLYAKAYSTGAEACKVEKKLHKTATKIHPSIRKFKGAKKLMDNGHTECYEYSQEAVNYLLFTLQF
jgi:hypothetical protein